MAVQVTSEYIELLNQAVSREIQVSIQYMLQHTKMEKLMRKLIGENILLDKTTYEAIGKFLKEKKSPFTGWDESEKLIRMILIPGKDISTKPPSA